MRARCSVLGVLAARRRPRCLALAAAIARRARRSSTSRSSLLTFLAAAALTARVIADGPLLVWNEQFFVDPFNVFLVALTAFVAFTTSLFSPALHAHRAGARAGSPPRACGSITACTSCSTSPCCWRCSPTTWASCGWRWKRRRSPRCCWCSLYRTPASLEAAWKYFILCGVGIAQALFGTILLYFAAEKVLGAGGGALLWTQLERGARRSSSRPCCRSRSCSCWSATAPRSGLVPLHNWLPDAHAEGPTPISAVLSGLLLNVALYAVVRCKVLVEGALGRAFAGNLMMGFGLLSVVVAAFLLSRQKDIKRLFAYSSIEHMGLITFAFGMGGADRELRRAAAHDRALAHQVGDLLRRRPRRAEGRHAGDGRHPRPDRRSARRSAGG